MATKNIQLKDGNGNLLMPNNLFGNTREVCNDFGWTFQAKIGFTVSNNIVTATSHTNSHIGIYWTQYKVKKGTIIRWRWSYSSVSGWANRLCYSAISPQEYYTSHNNSMVGFTATLFGGELLNGNANFDKTYTLPADGYIVCWIFSQYYIFNELTYSNDETMGSSDNIVVDGLVKTDLQTKIQDINGIEKRAIYPGWSNTIGKYFGVKAKFIANYCYKFKGYVTALHIFSYDYKMVQVAVMDVENYTTPSVRANLYLSRGINHVEFDTPIEVTETKLLALRDPNIDNTHHGLTYVGGGYGYYQDGSLYYDKTFQYYLDYVTNLDGLESTRNNVEIIGKTVANESVQVKADTIWNVYNDSTMVLNTAIVAFDFKNIRCNDHIRVVPSEGYQFRIILTNNDLHTQHFDYTGGYVSTPYEFDFHDGDGHCLRVLCAKSNYAEISREEAISNVNVEVTRPVSIKSKDLSILFIGNSVTQDAVSYLPFLLRNLAPSINFRLYMWFVGGFKMIDHLGYFNNDTPCSTFSVAEDTTTWTHYSNEKTMSSILSTYKFDVLCLQEYYNWMDGNVYSDTDKQAYIDVINYVRDNYDKPFEVVTLMHAPRRGDPNNVYAFEVDCMKYLIKSTITDSIIPCGTAIYKALSTELDELGDAGHLSDDNTHAQEGLPCLLQAYVVLLWAYKKLGIADSVTNNKLYVTAERQPLLNITNADIGTGVIDGTESENRLAQDVAVQAFKEGLKLELDNLA